MERNVKEFLRETGADALEARRVLYANKRWGYLLQGTSVEPLIQLMRDQGITNLVSADRKWAITVDGWFRNPLSRGSKEGWIKCLAHPKNVFLNQNTWINPYFKPKLTDLNTRKVGGFTRITHNPEVMGGKPCIRGMRVTVNMVVGMIAAGHSPEKSF